MSLLQTGQDSAASGRLSKRKRAHVNYYEGELDTDELYVELEPQDLEFTQKKKRKPARVRLLPKKEIFPFLKLPAEIRNMIYAHALTDPNGVYLGSTTEKYRRTVMRTDPYRRYNGVDDEEESASRRARPFVPSLLAVCKQISTEGRDLLYGNDFKMEDPLTLHSFIVNIGPNASPLLKNITLNTWGRGRGMLKAYNHTCFAVLVLATNIETLTINDRLTWGGGGKWVARQLYRDGFPWLEAVGTAKGRFDAAIDLIDIREENYERSSNSRPDNNNPKKERGQKDFKDELSKLLGAHKKRIWSKPGKKAKKSEDIEL